MKAIHKHTKSEHLIKEMIGDRIHLINLRTGELKVLPYPLFKKLYTLTDEEPQIPEFQVNLSVEVDEASTMAKEVSYEATKIKKRNRVRIPSERPKKKTKPNRGSIITLKELCTELGLEPSKARKLLRKANIEKPGASWEWNNKEDIQRIKTLLK
jgi:hypothetical protein